MDRIIHYTSDLNWEMIQESGLLLPKSGATYASPTIVLSDRVRNVIQDDLYLVGMQKPLCNGLVEYGVMDYLLKHTSGEVILNVPIIETGRGFVRDLAHISPKRFVDQYGEDLCKASLEGNISDDDPRLVEADNKYVESTIPLDQYDGSYLAPEIWLPQETPVSKLTKI